MLHVCHLHPDSVQHQRTPEGERPNFILFFATTPPCLKMFHRLLLALPLLSLSFLAIASPLEQREAAPGLIEDLLVGTLNSIQSLIKGILSGAVSGITDEVAPKPLLCALDACCVCKFARRRSVNPH